MKFPTILVALRYLVFMAAVVALGFGIYNWIGLDYANDNKAMHPEFLPLHVPVAASSLILYLCMGICGILTLIFKIRIAAPLGRAIAYVGVVLAFVTLVTGSIWGRVTWQVWWVWDARLTTMLILFFLYLGYIAATKAFDNLVRRDQTVALLGIIGGMLVPLIYFSVRIWNTLHQTTGTKMSDDLLSAFLPMMFGVLLWSMWLILVNLEAELLADKQLLRDERVFDEEF